MSEVTASPRFFLVTRLIAWCLAELLCVAGNLTPRPVAKRLWGWAVRLNRHQEVAALNRALALLENDEPGAWGAFETVLTQLENRDDSSASDLHLSRTPGRAVRRATARLAWGRAGPPIDRPHDAGLQRTLARLAEGHFRRSVVRDESSRAGRAHAAWRSAAGDSPAVAWGAVELAWDAEPETVRALIEPLIDAGSFPSPLDTVRWGERLLDAGELELARRCLRRGRRWVPEIPRLWAVLGSLARSQGRREKALACWERALSLDPQNADVFLARLALERRFDAGGRLEGGSLVVEMPAAAALGGEVTVRCRLAGHDPKGWTLFTLPPAGWGLVPRPPEVPFDGAGRATLAVEARRPDRVRGEPWPLLVLAVGPTGHLVERRSIAIPDPEPGRVLVAVTEDHEIHEERGTLSPQLLRLLLVDKSRFAADLGVPWTHMVEIGSVLAMPDRAAEKLGGDWRELRAAIRRHLAEEAGRGHDLQPHLHAFNDPLDPRFPYAVTAGGFETSLRFLLTSAGERGAWASACPPPGASRDGGRDRLESVERAVARLEEVARAADPGYRAVLWRSGLLEYGASAADHAWSTAALRRAGLLATSDLPKPASPLAPAQPAFAAGWEEPFAPQPGGPLLQLPIAANLEGDYLMGPRLLGHRARSSIAALEDHGAVRPGVHLFTLLTHDKFINARRDRDEFRLDPEYGDWRTIRRHLAAWREAGAAFITAREGVEAVLDDLTWQPLPLLRGESSGEGSGGHGEARYRLVVLGRGIPASEAFPQHLPVPVPCSLRPHLEAAFAEPIGPDADAARCRLEIEDGAGLVWLRRTSEQPIAVIFRLRPPVGSPVTDFGGEEERRRSSEPRIGR